ncbi:MAG: hypothetical protein ABFD20_12745 [Anaerolineales bacterium]
MTSSLSKLEQELGQLRDRQNLTRTIMEMLTSVVSDEMLHEDFEYYVRAYVKDDQAALELSILTRDLIIHDFTFEQNSMEISLNPLSLVSQIRLRAFYSDTAEDDLTVPYRVELAIGGVNGIITYTVEGQREAAKKLMEYGQKCTYALHQARRSA